MATYPKEFEDLLQEYLTDGIITAKERQVLLRKAEKLGLDVEEVDLYIDAQQQKADQEVDAAVRKQRGQTCPFCGGSVPDLTDKCPHCGQHITVQANEELKEIIDQLEDALVDLKDSKNFERSKAQVERYVRKARMYYSNNPKIKPLLEEVNTEMVIAEKKYNAQHTWIKEHPYIATFLLLIVIGLAIGLIVDLDDYAQWMISLGIVFFGGLILSLTYMNKYEDEKKINRRDGV